MELFLLVMFSLVVGSVAVKKDRDAMLALAKGFQPHPPQWSTISSFGYCKWKGVACNYNNFQVASINLSGLSLSGVISPSIGLLSDLEELHLQRNNLTGEIPSSLAALPLLRILDVSNNNLTGVVPEFERSVKFIYRPGNRLIKHHKSSMGKAVIVTITLVGEAFIIVAVGFIVRVCTRLKLSV